MSEQKFKSEVTRKIISIKHSTCVAQTQTPFMRTQFLLWHTTTFYSTNLQRRLRFSIHLLSIIVRTFSLMQILNFFPGTHKSCKNFHLSMFIRDLSELSSIIKLKLTKKINLLCLGGIESSWRNCTLEYCQRNSEIGGEKKSTHLRGSVRPLFVSLLVKRRRIRPALGMESWSEKRIPTIRYVKCQQASDGRFIAGRDFSRSATLGQRSLSLSSS